MTGASNPNRNKNKIRRAYPPRPLRGKISRVPNRPVPNTCSECHGGPPQCDENGNYWNALHQDYTECPQYTKPQRNMTIHGPSCVCSGPTQQVQ